MPAGRRASLDPLTVTAEEIATFGTVHSGASAMGGGGIPEVPRTLFRPGDTRWILTGRQLFVASGLSLALRACFGLLCAGAEAGRQRSAVAEVEDEPADLSTKCPPANAAPELQHQSVESRHRGSHASLGEIPEEDSAEQLEKVKAYYSVFTMLDKAGA